MAKFCIVAPVQILGVLHDRDLLGNQHLLLAHDVVKHPKEYHHMFAHPLDKATYDDHRLIILDNSTYELKSSVDFGMVREAAAIVKPTCVVLPDHYLNGTATAIDTLGSIDLWATEFSPLGTCLMAIPQGKDYKEWLWCAERLAEHPYISWWGIPRNLQEKHRISRRDGAEILHSLNPSRHFHLFGFSDNYADDLLSSRLPYIHSIDSTTPLRSGSFGSVWSLAMDLPPRGTWWDDAQWNEAIIPSLEFTRKVFL